MLCCDNGSVKMPLAAIVTSLKKLSLKDISNQGVGSYCEHCDDAEIHTCRDLGAAFRSAQYLDAKAAM